MYKKTLTVDGHLFIYYYPIITKPDDWVVRKDFYNGYLVKETTIHKAKNRDFDSITVYYTKDIMTAIETKTEACSGCHNGYNKNIPSFVEFKNLEITAQNYSQGCNSHKYEKFGDK